MNKNKEKSFIDNSRMRINYLKSRIIINETLSNTTNKRINNKKINEREPRHYSRIKEKQEDNYIDHYKNKFNRNIISSVGKISKPQDSIEREKEILSLLKKTNSSVAILTTTVKTFRNNMDTTFKNLSDKINAFTTSQNRINRNLLRILDNLVGQN